MRAVRARALLFLAPFLRLIRFVVFPFLPSYPRYSTRPFLFRVYAQISLRAASAHLLSRSLFLVLALFLLRDHGYAPRGEERSAQPLLRALESGTFCQAIISSRGSRSLSKAGFALNLSPISRAAAASSGAQRPFLSHGLSRIFRRFSDRFMGEFLGRLH